MLDVINHTLFREDEQRLGQWLSARNVVGPFKAKPPAPPTEREPPATEAGDSRTA